ncbi:hypothetical protein AVEN_266941-1 [Araneus ventricosus]|uniref:Uncharacterized protein n=1 Tax=Araneus ventricosus TaxID=182803 RepID=A0A4Y2NXM3_ARAVE|nr:hypothetical protein AVEN_266941-1 [Araneus ventricosus]
MATNKKSFEDFQRNIGIKKLTEIVERAAENENFPRTARLCFTPNVPIYRQSRDDSDLSNLSNWLLLHNPLNDNCPKYLLIDIVSGMVAEVKTRCDNTKDIGEKLLSSTLGVSLEKLNFRGKKRVKPISTTSNALIIRNENVVLNPLQLFSRIAAVLQSNENFRDHLKYKLVSRSLMSFLEELLLIELVY